MVSVNESQNLRNILKIGNEPDFVDLPRMYVLRWMCCAKRLCTRLNAHHAASDAAPSDVFRNGRWV